MYNIPTQHENNILKIEILVKIKQQKDSKCNECNSENSNEINLSNK